VFRDSLGLVRGPRRRGGANTIYVFKTTRSWNEGASSLGGSWNEGRHAGAPELTLVRVADKEALDKYATARTAARARVNYQLKGILSQLTRVLTRLEGWTVGSTGVAEPMLMTSKCGKRRDEWR
jgi:hypothetical protein